MVTSLTLVLPGSAAMKDRCAAATPSLFQERHGITRRLSEAREEPRPLEAYTESLCTSAMILFLIAVQEASRSILGMGSASASSK